MLARVGGEVDDCCRWGDFESGSRFVDCSSPSVMESGRNLLFELS